MSTAHNIHPRDGDESISATGYYTGKNGGEGGEHRWAGVTNGIWESFRGKTRWLYLGSGQGEWYMGERGMRDIWCG